MIGVLFVIIAGGALVRPAEAQKVLYDDALASGWSSYSWAKVNVNRTNIVHSGTSAISVDVAAIQGVHVLDQWRTNRRTEHAGGKGDGKHEADGICFDTHPATEHVDICVRAA
jgi:hypothetical protein